MSKVDVAPSVSVPKSHAAAIRRGSMFAEPSSLARNAERQAGVEKRLLHVIVNFPPGTAFPKVAVVPVRSKVRVFT